MKRDQYWLLPTGECGLAQADVQNMVKPGYRLVKVFSAAMEPVMNPVTGRQAVRFEDINDIKPWREGNIS